VKSNENLKGKKKKLNENRNDKRNWIQAEGKSFPLRVQEDEGDTKEQQNQRMHFLTRTLRSGWFLRFEGERA